MPDLSQLMQWIIVVYVIYSVTFFGIYSVLEIKSGSATSGKESFKSHLNKFRNKKILLYLFSVFSLLFFVSWAAFLVSVLDVILNLNFFVTLENGLLSTWFGAYPTEEFNIWFVFSLLGIIGVKGLTVLFDITRILLDPSLEVSSQGHLDYRKKL